MNIQRGKEARKIIHEADTILSGNIYNLLIGLTILWGFIANFVMVSFFSEIFLSMNFILLIVGYFVLSIAGIIINKKSTNPIISFIGYNLLVIPIGAVLSVGLKGIDSISILNAIVITGIVSGAMMVIATIVPKFFLKMQNVLFFALLLAIITELGTILFLGYSPTIFDWIVAIIFCGFIGFDWVKSQEYQKTLDNAIDSAMDIYLDIINLFLRILDIIR